MNKFTDGPWSADWGDGITGPRAAYYAVREQPRIPIRSGEHLIAMVPRFSNKTGDSPQADASLIAVAPDMYKFIRDTHCPFAASVQAIASEQGREYKHDEKGCPFCNSRNRLLAKARGKS